MIIIQKNILELLSHDYHGNQFNDIIDDVIIVINYVTQVHLPCVPYNNK